VRDDLVRTMMEVDRWAHYQRVRPGRGGDLRAFQGLQRSGGGHVHRDHATAGQRPPRADHPAQERTDHRRRQERPFAVAAEQHELLDSRAGESREQAFRMLGRRTAGLVHRRDERNRDPIEQRTSLAHQ
jgi:hypothetical protein